MVLYSPYLSVRFKYSFKVSFSDLIFSNSLKDCSNSLFLFFNSAYSVFKLLTSVKKVLFPLIFFLNKLNHFELA